MKPKLAPLEVGRRSGPYGKYNNCVKFLKGRGFLSVPIALVNKIVGRRTDTQFERISFQVLLAEDRKAIFLVPIVSPIKAKRCANEPGVLRAWPARQSPHILYVSSISLRTQLNIPSRERAVIYRAFVKRRAGHIKIPLRNPITVREKKTDE